MHPFLCRSTRVRCLARDGSFNRSSSSFEGSYSPPETRNSLSRASSNEIDSKDSESSNGAFTLSNSSCYKDPKTFRSDNHRYGVSIERKMLLTNEDILFFGLSYVGFGEERQNVRSTLNIDRFKAHFGPEPRTVKDILHDLKEEFGSNIVCRDAMMAMNWLKLCTSPILVCATHAFLSSFPYYFASR